MGLSDFLKNVAGGAYSNTQIANALAALWERRCPGCRHLSMYRTKSFADDSPIWRCSWPDCGLEEPRAD